MNRFQFHILIFCIILILMNCHKSEPISNIPQIEYIGVNKKQMKQGDLNEDTLWLQFRFEDGDGDLGYSSSDSRTDIFVMDSRTGNIQDKFKIPELPPSNNDVQKGMLTIRILTTCCFYPPQDTIPPCTVQNKYPFDSLRYLIYIQDRAGHLSNTIQSDFVKLICF